jgi:type I restriction enzyme, S subunit
VRPVEATRAEREAVRDRLAAASLARLNAPDPEAFRDDARFALDNLAALSTRPDQIKQLRQTILNLAVRGKLVPQDPSDKPASELLKRIADHKALIPNSRARTKVASIQTIANDSAPFSPPRGWACAAFGDIVVSRDGERIPVSKEERNGRAKLFDY